MSDTEAALLGYLQTFQRLISEAPPSPVTQTSSEQSVSLFYSLPAFTIQFLKYSHLELSVYK